MKVTNLLTQADRDMFDRIDRECIAMHVPTPPKTFLKLEVADGAGEMVEVYQDRAHSWVRNAYNYLAYFAGAMVSDTTFGEGYLGVKTYGGSVLNNSTGVVTLAGYSGSAGDITLGISVGTGTGAESFESNALDAVISHGAAAGQLAYSAGVNNSAPVYNSGTKKWTNTLSRIMNNNSGASIVVGEVGLRTNASGQPLVCRDVLAAPVTVPNGGQLTVTYTIEMTFPG